MLQNLSLAKPAPILTMILNVWECMDSLTYNIRTHRCPFAQKLRN